jgi:two-component system, LytTR family, sensor histidine kinase AlgZ
MHPLLRSRARLGTYLLGWVPVALLMVGIGTTNQWSLLGASLLAFPLCLLGAFLFLSSWYLCRAFPLESGRPAVLWTVWLMAALLMGNLWAGAAWFGAQLLSRVPRFTGGPLGPWPGPFWAVFMATGILLYLATLVLHYLLAALERSKESERSEQELRVLARDAELKALRAQLNPHFLFNSLNSISALTTIDAGRARGMCVLLSDFFRKSLKLGERRTVKLAEELDLLRSYLAIEQIRFGSRLSVAWEIDPAAEEVEIPTLLLQPLVENAIKHGIAQIPEGGTVRIAARGLGSLVEIRVENPLDPDSPPPQGLGMGLRQVRLRLLGRYGDETRFEAGVVEGVHKVLMAFPRKASS